MNNFNKQVVRDRQLAEQTVLVRVDWNVPGDDSGGVADDYRIRQSLPTLQYLVDQQAKVVIISHRGRPGGKPESKYSLRAVAARAEQLLGQSIKFSPELTGAEVQRKIAELEPAQLLCLENLRFDPREKANDPELAAELADGCQLFVQDGFGIVHRAHASTAAITEQLPSVAGLLLEREVVTIQDAMTGPRRPLVSTIGGAKISDKLQVIERFMQLSDTVLVGGAMANTFMAAAGQQIGASKYEPDALDTARQLLDSKAGAKLVLLTDGGVGTATQISEDAERTDKQPGDVADGDIILDVVISQQVEQLVSSAQTVIWSGTVGYTELARFATGSARLAELISQRPLSIIGGGDTAGFAVQWAQRTGGQFSHVSTGGGASLDLMAGKQLPGVELLLDK